MAGDPDESSQPLTEYTELHGCSCKLQQNDLESLLGAVGLTDTQQDLEIGVGDDASARRIGGDRCLVSTIDFFTPIVDDPYEFGRIAACNAASDVFATGATEDLTFLVVLALPRTVTDAAVDILEGIVDAVSDTGGVIAGGHTILNPWPIAGGAVSATTAQGNLQRTSDAAPDERLYLTKPLGTQAAMGAARVATGEFSETIANASDRPVDMVAAEAVAWMTTPNDEAMRSAREFATAATDITGFGLRGQTRLLAERSGVGVEITSLPVIEGTPDLSALFGYGLEDGESAETSGGLLLSVPDEDTNAFESSLSAAGVFHHEIGRLTAGSGVRIDDPVVEPIRRS